MKQEGRPGRSRRAKGLYLILAVVIFAGAIFTVATITSNKAAKNSQRSVVAVVHITKTGFEPATLSVKQGTEIIWTNDDGSLHQVASNPYPKDTGLTSLKSEILNNDQTYEYTANTTGSFGYHDQLKPTVNGTLVVQKK